MNNRPMPALRGADAIIRLLTVLAAISAFSSGCLSTQEELPPSPPAQTRTITPSPTFNIPSAEPTSTRTPSPSLTPTPDYLSGLGTLLFADTFDNPGEWNLGQDQSGAASLSDGRLSLVISTPSTVRTAAAPTDTPEDFFVSVSARPEICRPGDVFGLAVKYASDSEHLRFLLDCDGSVSAVLVEGGNRLTLVPETPTFAAMSGARVSNELSVRSQDSIYTFIINGIEVFQVKETRLQGSGVGIILRSDSSELSTVNFDNFRLFSLSPDTLPSTTPGPSS